MILFTHRSGSIDLTGRVAVAGILNVTPDSFLAVGRCPDPEAAAAHARRMAAEGADILDIGAQSTRPGAVLLSAAEEWARLGPALAAVRTATSLPLSVDTFYREVAEKALENGADIINDISGGLENGMISLATARGAGLILMRPGGANCRDGTNLPELTKVFFTAAIRRAETAGLPLPSLVLDPGIGFGSSNEGDAAMIAQLPWIIDGLQVLAGTAVPAIMVGASCKRFLAPDRPPADRLSATVAAHAVAVWQGARLLRVHDVAAARQSADLVMRFMKQRNTL
ncbi:MAG: dihydropteroate synthase [Oscillospiraceae bacterium]|nr:dihydropteroate synthase [Oscillospiraceae bacterium]